MNNKEIIDKLNNNRDKNISLLGMIENYGIKSSFKYQTLYFASLESWMIPVISQNREIEWELKTERLILPDETKTASLLSEKAKEKEKSCKPKKEFVIRELRIQDADFIFAYSHYQDFTSKADNKVYKGRFQDRII